MDYEDCLHEILDILKSNNVFEVEMLFGWAWGNEYKNWTLFITKVEGVPGEIDYANKYGRGSFYDDDTIFFLTDINTEILFCHEHDIHLSYNEANPIVHSILDAWNAKDLILEKRNAPR